MLDFESNLPSQNLLRLLSKCFVKLLTLTEWVYVCVSQAKMWSFFFHLFFFLPSFPLCVSVFQSAFTICLTTFFFLSFYFHSIFLPFLFVSLFFCLLSPHVTQLSFFLSFFLSSVFLSFFLYLFIYLVLLPIFVGGGWMPNWHIAWLDVLAFLLPIFLLPAFFLQELNNIKQQNKITLIDQPKKFKFICFFLVITYFALMYLMWPNKTRFF